MSLDVVSLETLQELARQYGYWAVLLGILIENTGIPIPGETITLVGGFLAGSGELDYWLVLGSAIAGAIVGDNFGYWIGVYGGWPLLLGLGRVFRIPEAQLVAAKARFGRNAARAVFLGRFVALLRIFAGPMAGISGMAYGQFLAYNSAGAIVWASVMVTLSFVLGQMVSLEQLVTWVGQFGLVTLGLVAAWIGISLWLELRTKEVVCAEQLKPDSDLQSNQNL